MPISWQYLHKLRFLRKICIHLSTAVTDNYQNVGYKLIAAFRWLSLASKGNNNNTLEWILKLDDDVLLNVKEVREFIQEIQDTKSIYCHVYKNAKPFRNGETKW